MFIGAGFLGTGFLDGYHAIVTSEYFIRTYPSPPESLIPWSWIASRLYLSVFLFWAYLNYKKESQDKAYKIKPKLVYQITFISSIASFIFFATTPLPQAYYDDFFFHRPEELLPALFFGLAFIGFYTKGGWKKESFEYWLVMALIVSFISQVVFMSFLHELFDYEFDMAHLLKKASYIAVLIGIYISMLHSFQKEVTLTNELKSQKEQFETIYQTTMDGLAILDLDTNFIQFNGAYTELTGYSKEELLQKSCVSMSVPEDVEKSKKIIQEVLEKGYVKNFEKSCVRKDGSIINIDMSISLMADKKHFLVSTKDMTQYKHLMSELEKQHTHLQKIIDGMRDPIMVINKAYNVILMNKAATIVANNRGFKEKNNPKCFEMVHLFTTPCKSNGKRCLMDEVSKAKTAKTILHKEYDENGHERLVEVSITPLLDDDGEVYAFIESGHDVTELVYMKEELHRQINYDKLTTLPNRTLFMELFNDFVKKSQRHKNKAAIILIDIDHLKGVNDSFGHKAGDKVIKKFAKWLSDSVRGEDTVARFGGNTFGVLLENIDENMAPIRVLENLTQIIKDEHILIDDNSLSITYSAGISIYPDDGKDIDAIYRNADAALYLAKDSGRNNYKFYTNELTQKAYERVMLESSLRYAYKNEDFMIYYQPQYDARYNSIIGAEALLRWEHKTLGFISPAKFIPALESSNLMVGVGEWIIKTVFLQTAKWMQDGLNPGVVSINLSMVQLRRGDELVQRIEKLLDETNCKAQWIGFEVTESMMMENQEFIIDVLNKISKMGFMISLDDFGTGYSSLAYLKKLPINKLKIDKSFIDDLPDDKDDVILSKTIISMAENFGFGIIAEGVEKSVQKEFLLLNGCHEIQGFFYSKPLSAVDITTVLKDKKVS
ncbi:MAG: EAL domain-containing protein [Campylobacterales bacterium]|nr:EAL domain-containing protein [Campylobacterales bacterium]